MIGKLNNRQLYKSIINKLKQNLLKSPLIDTFRTSKKKSEKNLLFYCWICYYFFPVFKGLLEPSTTIKFWCQKWESLLAIFEFKSQTYLSFSARALPLGCLVWTRVVCDGSSFFDVTHHPSVPPSCIWRTKTRGFKPLNQFYNVFCWNIFKVFLWHLKLAWWWERMKDKGGRGVEE